MSVRLCLEVGLLTASNPENHFMLLFNLVERDRNIANLVVPDHTRVHLSQVSALLVVVDSLPTLTFDKLFPYDSGLHGSNPGLPNVVVLLVQSLWVVRSCSGGRPVQHIQ
jgi:hypothetical protein